MSTYEGVTPLILAAFEGHTDIANLLIDHGADTTTVTSLGTTAEDCDSQSGHSTTASAISLGKATRQPKGPSRPAHKNIRIHYEEPEEAGPIPKKWELVRCNDSYCNFVYPKGVRLSDMCPLCSNEAYTEVGENEGWSLGL